MIRVPAQRPAAPPLNLTSGAATAPEQQPQPPQPPPVPPPGSAADLSPWLYRPLSTFSAAAAAAAAAAYHHLPLPPNILASKLAGIVTYGNVFIPDVLKKNKFCRPVRPCTKEDRPPLPEQNTTKKEEAEDIIFPYSGKTKLYYTHSS